MISIRNVISVLDLSSGVPLKFLQIDQFVMMKQHQQQQHVYVYFAKRVH